MKTKTLKTIQQVATEQGVSVTTIHNRIKDGKYKVVKVGRADRKQLTLIEE